MNDEYKIIGGDGVEYGPASLDELKRWIGDGRVAGFTQVWRKDLALWTPAARYAELQQDLARLQATVSPEAAARKLRAAGFWLRLGAYLMDGAVLGMIFGVICQWQHWALPAMPVVLNQESLQKYMDQYSPVAQQAVLSLFCLTVLYDVLFNGTFGATLGKMAVGAKIIGADGSPLGYGRALVRSLAERFTLFVGFLWILARPDKRGLHDLVAGTRVIMQR